MGPTHDSKHSVQGNGPDTTCAWSACWTRSWVKKLAKGAVILMILGGGWALWSRGCAHCRLEAFHIELQSLQKQVDQLSVRSQVQDTEALEQKQLRFAERLDLLEQKINQISNQDMAQKSSPDHLTLFDEVRHQIKDMDEKNTQAMKREVRWVRLALLMHNGQPFSGLLEQLEPELRKSNFPDHWIQDIKAWSDAPAPSCAVLMARGSHLMKHYHKTCYQSEGSQGAHSDHPVWAWVKHQWGRVFSIHPQKCHHDWTMTLEDMIQKIEETHKQKPEESTALGVWLKQAEQRVQLDKAVEALWASLIED